MRQRALFISIAFAVILSGTLFYKNYFSQTESQPVVAVIERSSTADTVKVYKTYQTAEALEDNGGVTPAAEVEVVEEPLPLPEPVVEEVVNASEPRLIDDIIKLLETLSPFLVPIITYYFARKEKVIAA